MKLRVIASCLAAAVTVVGGALAGTASAAVPHAGLTVLHVGQIARQDVASQPKSEPDTLVEPDIAVDPYNARVAVAVAHDSRFPDGGAVDISYAWTHDGGATWHHAPVPGLTTAAGGTWPRASDPVLAWGPDGSVYLSILAVNTTACPSGVAVLRSTDGGRTWSKPVLADSRTSCGFSDDKNWIVVDRSPDSPFYDRVYQFWTPFLYDAKGNYTGSPQAVRWSDDHGRTWSGIHFLTPKTEPTQNSQPMIRSDGTVVDMYDTYTDGGGEGPETPIGPETPMGEAQGGVQSRRVAAAVSGDDLVTRTSRNGGATWSAEHVVATNIGEGPKGVRCCLASATIDPTNDRLYAAWLGDGAGEPIRVSTSTDGATWSAAKTVSRDGTAATMTHVNVDVAAYRHRAIVSYGTRDTAVAGGRYVRQKVVSSADDGARFGVPRAIGPRSDLTYAAQADGAFPGDYIGTSAAAGRFSVAWCVSAHIRGMLGPYHQTLYAAVLAP